MKDRAKKFVEDALSDGFTKDQIISAMQEELEGEVKREQFSVSKILLYIGAIVMVLAGVIYASLSWFQWTPIVRILVVGLVTFITFSIGVQTWNKTKGNIFSLSFMAVGSLLFPIFLIITFSELEIFDKMKDGVKYFAITVSALSTLLYCVVSRVFRDKVWTLLISISVFATYFFILTLIFPDSFLFLKPRIAWFTALLSVIYVLVGLALERMKKVADAYYLYAIGNFILFFSAIVLVLNNIFLFEKVEHAAIFAGAIYLALAGASEYLAKTGYFVFGLTRPFYELIGSFCIQVGLFMLGVDGHQIVYEILLLASSLAFIFSSIPRVSKSYLYSGSIFLVVFIFNMSFEYFNDVVGWPIALFVAGLLSMLIGYYIEQIKKKYFQTSKEISTK